ncbi:MAG TPA: orotate phosphoribosyltransferase [Fimbriimonadales bacterium]|nr:orotate phosphoribosyltransferase [Fimbriimonadales bacterium]
MDDLLSILEETGAILKGHFILSSGRHSDTYFEKFRLLERPEIVEKLCCEIASFFQESGTSVVAGPTTGGIIIAYEVAKQMKSRAVYIEREGGQRVLRRGFSLSPEDRILVVDDVLTTGKSIFEVLECLKGSGAKVSGVAVLVDRSEEKVDFGVPFYSVIRVEARSWAPDEVPDWLAKIPVEEPGSRRL